MKRLMAMMLVFAVASFLVVAYAGKGDKGHGHDKAGAAHGVDHHTTAAGAMAPHGDKEHLKAMSDNYAGLMGIMTGLINNQIQDREEN